MVLKPQHGHYSIDTIVKKPLK
uniref:Uncharacterized protein n=1 Tax=Anguilla anguilla TaxID=7936 RepID=A0A0E9SDH9_ANGAN